MKKDPIKFRYLNNMKFISDALSLEELGEYMAVIAENIKGIIHIYFPISELITVITLLK
ncbi:MAG: hypothetical protein PHX70_13870 [Clostridium sp.]|nr:hypothetical protein [Clostridium sp.]